MASINSIHLAICSPGSEKKAVADLAFVQTTTTAYVLKVTAATEVLEHAALLSVVRDAIRHTLDLGHGFIQGIHSRAAWNV